MKLGEVRITKSLLWQLKNIHKLAILGPNYFYFFAPVSMHIYWYVKDEGFIVNHNGRRGSDKTK